MKFKTLELQDKPGWFKRIFSSRHTLKTALFMLAGAGLGFLYYYYSIGRNVDVITAGDILKSTLAGAFFGFFLTNSPCMRNKC